MTLPNQILEFAIKFQQIPAPTFEEAQRADFIQECFQAENLQDVIIDSLGNVYGCLPGKNDNRSLVVSAHSDTVFPMDTSLEVKRSKYAIHGPGIGDNSLGVAGLLGLIWSLQERGIHLPGDLWLVANVCEEGLGDLRGMRAVVERFGSDPLAYIVLEGMALGQVYNQGLGVQRYRISAQTGGGHSWVDYGNPSAIHELADLITQITALELPEDPRTSLNVGVIHGGTSINTIAAEASMELDLRSASPQELSSLSKQVEMMVERSNQRNIQFQAEIIGRRPSGIIPPDHPLVKLALKTLKDQGLPANLNIGSTDANIPLSLGLPSVCIGLTRGSGAHTVQEYIQTQPLEAGINQLIELVTQCFQIL